MRFVLEIRTTCLRDYNCFNTIAYKIEIKKMSIKKTANWFYIRSAVFIHYNNLYSLLKKITDYIIPIRENQQRKQ